MVKLGLSREKKRARIEEVDPPSPCSSIVNLDLKFANNRTKNLYCARSFVRIKLWLKQKINFVIMGFTLSIVNQRVIKKDRPIVNGGFLKVGFTVGKHGDHRWCTAVRDG